LAFDILWDLPAELGLNRVSSPWIMHDGQAYVGFVFLKESHAAIRIQNNEMMLDILTCRSVDIAKLESFLEAKGLRNIQLVTLDRQI